MGRKLRRHTAQMPHAHMGLIRKSFLLRGKQSSVTPIETLMRVNIKMARRMAKVYTGTLLVLISTMAVG